MKKFSDFVKQEDLKMLDGDKVKIDEIIGKEILIIGFSIDRSKYKTGTDYLKLQFEKDGKRNIVFTGSKRLIELITKYSDNVPFLTTIRQAGKSFIFS